MNKRLILTFASALFLSIFILSFTAWASYPEGYSEFLNLQLDEQKSASADLLTKNIVKELYEPAEYQIIDIEEGGDDYCHRFYAEKVEINHSRIVKAGVPIKFKVSFIGESVDGCYWPYSDLEEGECESLPDGSERCNLGQRTPFTLTIEKKEKRLFVEGTDSNIITIIRKPIEKIASVWEQENPSFYDYKKVPTKGTLTTTALPSGEQINIYTTNWRPIFNDLRGISYFLFQQSKLLMVTKRFYIYPTHNEGPAGQGGGTPYEQCLTEAKLSFCIKQENKKFVLASREALGTALTLWIDTQFKQ